jgi:hypothetical protein
MMRTIEEIRILHASYEACEGTCSKCPQNHETCGPAVYNGAGEAVEDVGVLLARIAELEDGPRQATPSHEVREVGGRLEWRETSRSLDNARDSDR